MLARHRVLQAISVVAAVLGVSAVGLVGVKAQEPPTAWQVGKSSGEVWILSSAAQPVALGGVMAVNGGDAVRTGRNGRVLLVRGADSILVSPNSSIVLPATDKDATSTTILQQAGSILLEVDRKAPRTFEVETPYLVAAVKGTKFRVTLTGARASVDVTRGAVEVADLRSGQHVAVLVGQTAAVPVRGDAGLSITGTGTLGPVLNGAPRQPSVRPLLVPRRGLSAPRSLPAGQHAYKLRSAARGPDHTKSVGSAGRAGLRISVPLGEIKLNVQKATRGLARANVGPGASHGSSGKTFWTSGDAVPGNGVGKTYDTGNSGSGNGNAYGITRGNGNAGENGNATGNGQGNGNGLALGRESGNRGGNGNGLALGRDGGNGNRGGNPGGNGHGRGRK